MLYAVSILNNINFAPNSLVAEVVQNVQTILATVKGSVPLDRDFGIDWSFVDEPIPQAMMLARADIIDAITAYEPRAKVRQITFKTSMQQAMQGKVVPVVVIEIKEQ